MTRRKCSKPQVRSWVEARGAQPRADLVARARRAPRAGPLLDGDARRRRRGCDVPVAARLPRRDHACVRRCRWPRSPRPPPRSRPILPGVSGEAATAAVFAGCWAERLKLPAAPVEGQRLYELGTLRHPTACRAGLRRACNDDGDLLVGGCRASKSTPAASRSTPETLRRRIGAGPRVDLGPRRPVAMAAFTTLSPASRESGSSTRHPSIAGTATRRRAPPPSARSALDAGADRCILYTQLANPQSNAIYRRLGYEPIQETVHYRFG